LGPSRILREGLFYGFCDTIGSTAPGADKGRKPERNFPVGKNMVKLLTGFKAGQQYGFAHFAVPIFFIGQPVENENSANIPVSL
jgi:hypothetical protein